MATDLNKTSEDYNTHKKPYNNNRRKSKPKNQSGIHHSPSNNHNVVLITTGPKGSIGQIEGGEEEGPDDNVSVCSSHSSGASEHSVTVNKRTKKVRRVRCEIHSKRSKDSSLVEENETNERKSAEVDNDQKDEKRATPVCTCASGRLGVRRPEPEGGVLPGGKGTSHGAMMSELEQILFSSEPLFSDVDEDKEAERNDDGDEDPNQTKQNLLKSRGRKQETGLSLEEQAKRESDRFHNRLERSGGGGNLESTFSSVQMLTTNTAIKFAILQTELKNIKDRSLKRVEADINAVLTRFSSMQELMENSEVTLSSFTLQLQHTSKVIGAQLERERKEERELVGSHVDMDVNNVSHKQTFCSLDLDVANNRISYLERIAVGIESEMKSLGSSSSNETARLSTRLKEVMGDITSTERSLVHISSCLHNR